MRSHTLWRLSAVVGATVAALVMGSVLLGAAVQRGVVGPPQFEVRVGALRLAGFVTRSPNCRTASYWTTTLCSTGSLYTTSRYFVVWAFERSRSGAATVEEGRRLLVIPLEGSDAPPGPRP